MQQGKTSYGKIQNQRDGIKKHEECMAGDSFTT
jgi:hypothetical protein